MDMLVRLYALPDARGLRDRLHQRGVVVRPAMAHEKATVVDWVEREFGADAAGWRSECDVAFARLPVACWIALQAGRLCGFSCYDAAARNLLGPVGVAPGCRMQGIGRLLVLSALDAIRAQGYAYAVIGCVGPAAFFERCAGAVAIPGSTPGIYPPSVGR